MQKKIKEKTNVKVSEYIYRYKTGLIVHIRSKGKIDLLKHFPFANYEGNKAAALKAAKEVRNAYFKLRKIPIRKFDGNGFYLSSSNKNSGGVVGIILHADDRGYAAWGVTMKLFGERKHYYRSIRKFGYTGAWREARKIRMAHTGIDIPENPPPPPAWFQDWLEKNNLVHLVESETCD